MAYRDFSMPAFASHAHGLSDWLEWLAAQGALIPTAPDHPKSCTKCLGASNYHNGADTWPECLNCQRYDGSVDSLFAITYSTDAGLESMLHRYKDFATYNWLRYPLAALLVGFLSSHTECLNGSVAGGLDIATTVPSDATRSFDPMGDVLFNSVSGSDIGERWTWERDFLKRDLHSTRPGRGQLKPAAYTVDPFVVEGAAVLLVDDTWTSGSSAASAAAALKQAGARHVTAVTIGRQLNVAADYGSTAEIFADVSRSPWSRHLCRACS